MADRRLIVTGLTVAALLASGAASERLRAADDPPAGATRMLRQPTVSATHIAFAHAGNIWLVERTGGTARRVTSFQGQASHPQLSPDGRQLAFSADYGGNPDVYVVPVAGGEPARLTWHPGPDLVQGWSHDGARVLFTSPRATAAPNATPRFWTVPAAGGAETPLPLPRGNQGKISPDGRRLAYRMNTSWDEERRNYRGGQNKAIWIADLTTHDVVTPPWTGTKEMDPVWLGDTVYFLSDRDGMSNVWSFAPGAKQLVQVTRFTDFDVKTLGSGGGVLVFEQAGLVHLLDPAAGKPSVVPITVTGDFPWMMPHWEDVTARMSNLGISPTGKRVLVEARGEVFTIPAERGDIRNLTRTSGAAEREPAWSPDGQYVSYFSDASGEYRLLLESQDGVTAPREIALPSPTRYYSPVWSPDSRKLLYTDTNLNVWVLDIASGTTKTVGRDPWMVPQRTLAPSWSPDSRWVAFATRLDTLYRAIVVVNVETGERRQITDGLADATYPVWDASGKYLWFLASTDLGLRSQWLDMTSYERLQTFGLYVAVLRKGEPSPVLPQSDEDAGVGAKVEPTPLTASSQPVTIDFDGLAGRVLAIPGVPERQYSRLQAGAAGTVFFLEAPPVAERGGPAPATGSALRRYRLSDRAMVAIAANVGDFAVSADGRKLAYRTPTPAPPGGGRPAAAPSLHLVDADGRAPENGAGRLTVSLAMDLDPKAEFRQIFNEGWRYQRDYLYVPNQQGSDWPAMKTMYGALVPHVRHRADLTYLLDMMGAEIAIGHSYVRGGDLPDVPPTRVGLLGADTAIENGRYRLTRIYDGESWNPDLRAPLAAPGVDVASGDYLLAVNGVELTGAANLHRLLDGTVNRQTVLTVNAQPTMTGARQVTVVPVANDQGLRTRAWVEDNRRLVDRLSGGRLAYVYVPNTGQPGYQSFNRYYFAQQDRAGAVIDERYNGGGSAADYIIDVLARDFDGYFNNVAGDRVPFTSPSAGIWGPKVMIVNEMAGSGGDLMPYMFRRRKIGPLVGTRTWGGLVHTADTPPFIDGGTMIAPRGGFFTRDGKWAVENEGVAPDIEVENWPKDVIGGRDPQLERAVEEALKALQAAPPDSPRGRRRRGESARC
ncbi:MAG: PDZ domain-containing protein [Vicinamibacterales bacterium]